MINPDPAIYEYAGIVASHILKASITGQELVLADGPGNDLESPNPAAPNFFVCEVA